MEGFGVAAAGPKNLDMGFRGGENVVPFLRKRRWAQPNDCDDVVRTGSLEEVHWPFMSACSAVHVDDVADFCGRGPIGNSFSCKFFSSQRRGVVRDGGSEFCWRTSSFGVHLENKGSPSMLYSIAPGNADARFERRFDEFSHASEMKFLADMGSFKVVGQKKTKHLRFALSVWRFISRVSAQK